MRNCKDRQKRISVATELMMSCVLFLQSLSSTKLVLKVIIKTANYFDAQTSLRTGTAKQINRGDERLREQTFGVGPFKLIEICCNPVFISWTPWEFHSISHIIMQTCARHTKHAQQVMKLIQLTRDVIARNNLWSCGWLHLLFRHVTYPCSLRNWLTFMSNSSLISADLLLNDLATLFINPTREVLALRIEPAWPARDSQSSLLS